MHVCDVSYYEWHRTPDGKKQPYFIYFQSPSEHKSDSTGEQHVIVYNY